MRWFCCLFVFVVTYQRVTYHASRVAQRKISAFNFKLSFYPSCDDNSHIRGFLARLDNAKPSCHPPTVGKHKDKSCEVYCAHQACRTGWMNGLDGVTVCSPIPVVYHPSCFCLLVWVTGLLNEGRKTSPSSSNRYTPDDALHTSLSQERLCYLQHVGLHTCLTRRPAHSTPVIKLYIFQLWLTLQIGRHKTNLIPVSHFAAVLEMEG